MNIRDLATEVAQKLVEAGFVVHRYNAYSTQSVYLKLDYGVANSIRISDHKGKEKLSYRYNIMVGEKKYREDLKGKYPRYYYPAEKVDELLCRIEKERKTDRAPVFVSLLILSTSYWFKAFSNK